MKLPLTSLAPAAVLATSAHAQGLDYPATRKVDQTDSYHGTVVADPYRWLEDDNSAETKAWVVEQNKVTDKFLEAMPQRLPARRIYTELYNFERYGIPFTEGGRYFWTRNDGLQQQNVLYTANDFGIYVTTNGGTRWEVLGGNLPSVAVMDFIIHPRDRMAVIATHGRGVWALDVSKIK